MPTCISHPKRPSLQFEFSGGTTCGVSLTVSNVGAGSKRMFVSKHHAAAYYRTDQIQAMNSAKESMHTHHEEGHVGRKHEDVGEAIFSLV